MSDARLIQDGTVIRLLAVAQLRLSKSRPTISSHLSLPPLLHLHPFFATIDVFVWYSNDTFICPRHDSDPRNSEDTLPASLLTLLEQPSLGNVRIRDPFSTCT